MKTLNLLVLFIGMLTWVECAPYQQDDYDKLENLNEDTEQFQLGQEHEDALADLQQQAQREDLHQYQQEYIPKNLLLGHLEDLSQSNEELQQTKENDATLDSYHQQSEPENLERFPEQHGQLREIIPESDYNQQSHPEGSLGPQSGPIEELGNDDDDDVVQQLQGHENLREYDQQSQSEDLNQYREQQEQIQDHDSFIDDSQQQSQVEDLSQFQQGLITNVQQSGRLENLDDDSEILQQHQEKQTENMYEYPEQQGQIQDLTEVQSADDTQQIQDHDSFIDDSQQQSQVEDLSHFQQGLITNVQQSGRLENLDDDSEILQQHQEKQTEDLYLDQEQGQMRQDVHGHDSGELFDGSEQQKQNEDLGSYSIGQFRTEPKIPALQISQVRHEQQPYSYNAQNVAAEVESHERGRSSMNNHEEQVPLASGGELHQQPSDYSLNSENSYLNVENHFPTTPAPGFWKRLHSKLETAYGKAKDKGRHVIQNIKERIG